MAETVFNKDGRLAYAYNAAQEVNLRADGWADGPPPVDPEVPSFAGVVESMSAQVEGPVPVEVPTPVDPAPPAQEAPT